MKIKTVYDELVRILQNAEIEHPSFEAKQLLLGFLHLPQDALLLNQREITKEEEKHLRWMAEKRTEHYPLQYLVGEWEFFGLPFLVGEGVLIPRQDTETLCEVLLDRLKGQSSLKIIDLCSGSGCIAITLEHYLKGTHQIYALEKSKQALDYLKKNKKCNHSQVIVLEDDALNPQTLESGFDVIVSNPPYLNDQDMRELQTEVSYEPKEALYAEHDGYLFYEQLTKCWKDRLKPGGILAYEIGIHQEKRVAELMSDAGFVNICFYRDICGIIRVVLGEKQTF